MSLTEANTFKGVAVVMGSDSDLKTLQPAVAILDQFGISNEVRILSAHRTPKEMMDFAQMAESNGFGVIIAGAGGAAHLPGMIASLTTLPVIGVPVKSKALSGIDSMYSILQMPSGIPVATVAIEGGINAALLATQILAINNTELTNKLKTYRSELHDLVMSRAPPTIRHTRTGPGAINACGALRTDLALPYPKFYDLMWVHYVGLVPSCCPFIGVWSGSQATKNGLDSDLSLVVTRLFWDLFWTWSWR